MIGFAGADLTAFVQSPLANPANPDCGLMRHPKYDLVRRLTITHNEQKVSGRKQILQDRIGHVFIYPPEAVPVPTPYRYLNHKHL